MDSFHMNDFYNHMDSTTEAIERRKTAILVRKRGGFNITKPTKTALEIINALPEEQLRHPPQA